MMHKLAALPVHVCLQAVTVAEVLDRHFSLFLEEGA